MRARTRETGSGGTRDVISVNLFGWLSQMRHMPFPGLSTCSCVWNSLGSFGFWWIKLGHFVHSPLIEIQVDYSLCCQLSKNESAPEIKTDIFVPWLIIDSVLYLAFSGLRALETFSFYFKSSLSSVHPLLYRSGPFTAHSFLFQPSTGWRKWLGVHSFQRGWNLCRSF